VNGRLISSVLRMCFAAEASFASGAVIGAVGVATLRCAVRRRELLLASLPLLFAAHQLVLEVQAPMAVGAAVVWPYIVHAHALLPVILPLSILLIETGAVRRSVLWILLALGAGARGLRLVDVRLVSDRLRGRAPQHRVPRSHFGKRALSLYVIATSTTQFLARSRWLMAFGGLNIIGPSSPPISNRTRSLPCGARSPP
jgi:hypothetical protein